MVIHYQLLISNDIERIFKIRLSTNNTDNNFSCFFVVNIDQTPARSVSPYDIINVIQELSGKPGALVIGNGETGLAIKCTLHLYRLTKFIH